MAQRTNTNERYVREWLLNQAAGGYIEYDKAGGTYSLTPEQAVALTNEDSPFYVGGGFFVVKAMTAAVPRIEEYFRNGGGMRWGEHDPDLFIGTEKFFRPGYSAHLVASWIPSLTGMEDKLKSGGRVADVGCGHAPFFRRMSVWRGVRGNREVPPQSRKKGATWGKHGFPHGSEPQASDVIGRRCRACP